MFGRRALVKCFNATYASGAYAGRADLGYRTVPVDRIVGSVGRCQELDDRFRPLEMTRERQARLERIRRLVEQGAGLPPIELYKLKDEYFVIDGNHRVAAAKANDQVYIDAHVIEFLPDGQRAEDQLYLERRAFSRDTGLEDIRLSQLGGFDRLREEIAARQEASGEGDLKEAAGAWYREVYAPAVAELEERQLPERADKGAGDLYLDLQAQRASSGESWAEALRRLEALYPEPSPSEWLAAAWRGLIGRIQAWWHGLSREELPCAYAQQAPDGTVYCRRAERMERFQ